MEENETKYNHVKNYLLSLIAANSGKPKYRLPTEKQLSEKFGCSRITSKYALTLLEQEGLVYRVRGSGTYINNSISVKHTPSTPLAHSVALLVPDIKSKFMAEIVHGIEKTLRENEFTLLLAITDYNRKTEKKLLSEFAQLGVGGFIVYPADNQVHNSQILKLITAHYPIVLVDRELRDISANCVSSPHEHNAKEAVEFLIRNGHRRIGILGSVPIGTTTLMRRISGYEQALSAHGLPIDESLECVSLKRGSDNREETISRFIDSSPDMTAVFVTDSDTGYALLRILASKNLPVPERISVVLCDDEYADIMQFMNVNPARIEQDPSALGRHAAKLLLETIASPAAPPRSVLVSSTFIPGNTVKKLN